MERVYKWVPWMGPVLERFGDILAAEPSPNDAVAAGVVVDGDPIQIHQLTRIRYWARQNPAAAAPYFEGPDAAFFAAHVHPTQSERPHKTTSWLDEAASFGDFEAAEPSTEEIRKSIGMLHQGRVIDDPERQTITTFLKSRKGALVLTYDEHRGLKAAYSDWDGAPQTINQICRQFHISRRVFVEYKRIHGWTHDSDPFTPTDLATRSIDDLADDALESRRDALYHRYKAKEWAEIKASATKWREFQATTLASIERHIEAQAATWQIPRVRIHRAARPYAVVVSPTDLHFGMYAWDEQTGDGYDRAECRRRLRAATEDLIARLPGTPDQIYYATCSDTFHVDGAKAQTTKGTEQDVDGTPEQVFVEGLEVVRDDVAMWAQIAPVTVIGMLGNHDRANGISCLLYLDAWYRGDDRITIDRTIKPRIYHRYGATGLQFHHGDRTKPEKLGPCFATEAREMWGQTRYHVAYTGHLHHERLRELNGVHIHQMPSLAGTDRWHAGAGYVDSEAALVAYMIDAERGPIGQLVSPVLRS